MLSSAASGSGCVTVDEEEHEDVKNMQSSKALAAGLGGFSLNACAAGWVLKIENWVYAVGILVREEVL